MKKKKSVNPKTGQWNSPNKSSKKKKEWRRENSRRDLWDNIKQTPIYIIGAQDGEKRNQGENLLEEKMVEMNSKTPVIHKNKERSLINFFSCYFYKQGNPHKTIRLFSRNSADQKGVTQYIEMLKNKIKPLPNKIF